MRRKPPRHVYSDTVTIKSVTSADAWGNPVQTSTTVSGVLVQSASSVVKAKDNTEVRLSAILFIDSIFSSPLSDLPALISAAEAIGHSVEVTHGSTSYTVNGVVDCRDEYGHFDHYEVELV